MGRRRRASIMDALDAFNGTYKAVGGVMRDSELRDIADAKPEEQVQVRDANQEELTRAKAETDAIAAEDAKTFAPVDGVAESAPIPASDYGMGSQVQTGVKHVFLGKDYAEAPTDIQKNSARIAAQAGVLGKYGDPVASAHLRAAGITLDEAERKRTDSDELRAVMSGGGGVSGILNKPAGQGVNPASAAATPGANQAQPGAAPDDNGLDWYTKNSAPRAIQTMLRQGNIEGAKKYQDFIESTDGKTYAKAWLGGVRRLAVGDNHGALKDFEGIYNQQLYSDGKTVKLKPSEDGSQYTVEQYDLTGKLLGSKLMPTDGLAKNAALFLEPTKAVTFFAEQEGKRSAEAAALEKTQLVEGYKDQRESMKEDRRDARLGSQLSSLERRSANKGSNITPTQESNNLEIVAARRKLTGMNAEDIRKKTQQYTATGRTNDDYDPQLARAVSLANQRKVGDDPEFDTHNAQKPQPAVSDAGALNRANVAKSFRSDRAMDGYRLGRDVPDSKDVPGGGVEVLDKTGKVVGHYR